MNKASIETLLSRYIKEIFSPTDKEKEFITTEYEKIQAHLGGRTFRIGSYARFTAVTKVKDLDIMCIDSNGGSLQDNIAELLLSLVALYGKDNIKQQEHSIQIIFPQSEIKFDIVPALETSQWNYDKSDKLFLLPTLTRVTPDYLTKVAKITEEGYILTDPKGYINDCTKIDEQSKGAFRKAVKFCKKYKNKQKNISEMFILKSFHIEQIIYQIIQSLINNTQEISLHNVIQKFFEESPKYVLKGPTILDRAYINQQEERYIDAYLSEKSDEEKSYTVRSIQNAQKIFNSLLHITTEEDAIRIIEDLTKIVQSPNKPETKVENIKTGFTSKPYFHDERVI